MEKASLYSILKVHPWSIPFVNRVYRENSSDWWDIPRCTTQKCSINEGVTAKPCEVTILSVFLFFFAKVPDILHVVSS